MIKNKIQSKLTKALDSKLIDATHPFSCTRVISSGRWNPITGQYENQETETYTGRGVLFGNYLKDLSKPSDYLVDDCKAIVLQNEVTAEPKIGDIWGTPKGDFRVINVSPDAADATWLVQIRKVTV